MNEYIQLMPGHIRRSLRWLWLIGVMSLVSTAPTYGWGSKGHEIVAAIAETHLTDSARQRIKELLPRVTTLADASTRPDKAGRQIPDMNPYHFVNFPKNTNTYDQQRDYKLGSLTGSDMSYRLSFIQSSAAT